MRSFFLLLPLLVLAMPSPSCAAEKKPYAGKLWTDPEAAGAESAAFRLQGEYRDESSGVQIAALSDGRFLVLTYSGGLPAAGWSGSEPVSRVFAEEEVVSLIDTLERVERTSPTLGREAPADAQVIFDGETMKGVEGPVRDELLWAGAKTTVPLRDFELHIEFRLPFKPGRDPGNQDRGNSGLYLFNNYEIQILDSFGLDFVRENNAIEVDSTSKQWCGCLYLFKEPDVPMALPPLAWQTYDIDFTAPRFEEGKKVANARITVRHNGVLIHDDVELPKGTGAGGKRPEKEEGLIFLQDHGNPVAFRNFWIRETSRTDGD